MEFYHEIFGGKLELYAGDEQGRPRPAQAGEPIMYGRLTADNILLIGSDGQPKYPPTRGDNLALALVGTDRSALSQACDKLAEGGQLKMPLRDAPWGGAAAWLTDRFGINWNIDVEPE
jgi:PhnB protein